MVPPRPATHLYCVEARDRQVKPRVVERSEDPPDDHKNCHRHDVARYQVDRKQVQVLAHQKLERMDIDGVQVAARRGLLTVVVLVHEPVNRLVMQRAVEERVEKIIHHVVKASFLNGSRK